MVTEAQERALVPIDLSPPASLSQTIPSAGTEPAVTCKLPEGAFSPSPTPSTTALNITTRTADPPGRTLRSPEPHNPGPFPAVPPAPRLWLCPPPPQPGPPSGTAAPAGPPPSHLRGYRRLLVVLLFLHYPRPGSKRRGTAPAPAPSGRHFVSSLGSDVGGRPAGSAPRSGTPSGAGPPPLPPGSPLRPHVYQRAPRLVPSAAASRPPHRGLRHPPSSPDNELWRRAGSLALLWGFLSSVVRVCYLLCGKKKEKSEE